MQTLPRLTAVEFRGELDSGATRPCVFLCEDENGVEAEHVTKLRQDVRSSGLTFEYVSARLAHHFEVPIPDPALRIAASTSRIYWPAPIASSSSTTSSPSASSGLSACRHPGESASAFSGSTRF